ncbi:hypothetical protein BOX15_Mlig030580g1, partial [Macrostomum lignano]
SNMNTIPTGRHLCACTNFKSPRSFHVQLRDDGGSGLRMLTKDLIKHHRSMQNVEIQPVLQPGRLVCAFQPDTGLAYRARVLPPNNYLSSVSVETLDFGEQLKFSAADLTPLPDELADRMPPQAVHCRLAGLGNSWPEVASSSLAERMLELESGADEEADDVKLWVEFPAATAETPVPVELSSEQGEQLNPWFLSLSGVQPEERPSPAAAVTDNGDNPWFAADVSHVTDDDGQLLVHLLKRSDRRKLDQLAADLDAFLRSAPLMSPPSPPPPSAAVRQVLFVARLPQRGPVRIRFEASAAAVSRRLLRLVDFGCTVVDLAAVPSLEPLPLDHPLAKLDPFCIACRPVSAAAKEVSTVGAAVSVNLLSLADAHRLIWLADLRPLEPGIPPYAAASRLKVGQTQPALLCWLDPATGTGRFLLRDDRRHLRRLADKLPGQDVSPATPPLPAGTPVMLAATPTAPARRATLLMELPDGAGPESHCRLLLVDYGVEVVAKLAELTVAPRTVASTPAWSLTARLANFGQADFPTGQLQCGRLTVVSVSLGSTVEVSFSPDLSLLPELLHALKPASNSKKHSPTAETVGLPAAYPVRTPVKGRDSCVVLHADHAASLHILMDCDAAIAKRIADRLSRYRPPARPGRGGGDQADNAEDNFPRDSACLAMDQRDACWRRALVLSQGESGGHYLVRLVDTGRLACLPGSLLAPLPDSLAEQPPCALHCSLANLQPGELAGPSVIASLRKLIGRPAIVTFTCWRASGVQVALEVNGRDVLTRLRQLRDQQQQQSPSSRRQSNSSESSAQQQQQQNPQTLQSAFQFQPQNQTLPQQQQQQNPQTLQSAFQFQPQNQTLPQQQQQQQNPQTLQSAFQFQPQNQTLPQQQQQQNPQTLQSAFQFQPQNQTLPQQQQQQNPQTLQSAFQFQPQNQTLPQQQQQQQNPQTLQSAFQFQPQNQTLPQQQQQQQNPQTLQSAFQFQPQNQTLPQQQQQNQPDRPQQQQQNQPDRPQQQQQNQPDRPQQQQQNQPDRPQQQSEEQSTIPAGNFPPQFVGLVCHACRIGPEELALFAQRVDEQTRLEELHELLQERAADQPALSAAELTVGTPCIALYEEDWYRARIVEPADAAGRLRVRFVDYGNESFGSAADELRVRRVPVSAAGVPALAAECRLRPPAGRRFADGCAAKLIALGEEDDGGLQLRLTSPRQPEGWWRAEVLDDRAATLLE